MNKQSKLTFSLCMIVKNEESVLARCLASCCALFDEIIIVDTGSTDRTKEIAAKFTDRIYDYKWEDDFAKARNFAFSKATGDYIYSCDADEVIDKKNFARFEALKEALLPEIEIVQMLYDEEETSVQNARREYRAKLFKRQRTFIWQDPVHETIRTEPIVYDSDIVILHRPQRDEDKHQRRDFAILKKAAERDASFSRNLYRTYATELYKCGRPKDFIDAIPAFEKRLAFDLEDEQYWETLSVLAHGYRELEATEEFFSCIVCALADGKDVCSEIFYELGEFYREREEWAEALGWYERALAGTAPVIDLRTAGDLTMRRMAECCDGLGAEDEADMYRMMADDWLMPEEQI